ncbi:MAG: M20 family metallopeptidase [Bacillota bacterium]
MTINWDQVGDEAADLLSGLIRIPSVAGQGHETEAARFIAAKAEAYGLFARVYEPVSGAGSVVISLPGQEHEDLLLLSHLDVVPPGDESAWRFPPFGGVRQDGAVWGRGAVDAKGLVVSWLMVMRLMARGRPLRRGMVMVASAGEEGGPHNGLQWLLDGGHLQSCRWALGEGGGVFIPAGSRGVVSVQTAEKGVLRARLPEGFVPKRLSGRVRGARGRAFAGLRSAFASTHGFPAWTAPWIPAPFLEGRGRYRIDLADQASHTWQVDSASRVLTLRVCPGSSTAQALRQIAPRLGLPLERLEVFECVEPTSSEPKGPLYSALQAEIRSSWDGVPAAPVCTPGYSDNRRLRAAGVPTYGFFAISAETVARQHRRDEHIEVDQLRQAIQVSLRLVANAP